MKCYKEEWEEWLIHGLRWKKGNHQLKESAKKVIVDVVNLDDFRGCKPIFITEKLDEEYWVHVSKETVRHIMTEEKLRNPWTKKHHIHRIRRPRKATYWEMSQFDGSYHFRLEDRWEERCLLLDIDDATGKIYAKLAENEGLECVVNFRIRDMLENGVPHSIYLDKFATYKVNHPRATDTKKLRTHFDKGMRRLGSRLISAHSPEAKWRVEKCNSTLQDRLVWELRLAKISTVAAANKFIKEKYISKFNKQFWVKPEKKGNMRRKLTEEEIKNLKWIFAKESLRSLGRDYVIQYQNNFYQIADSKDYTVYPKKQLLVAETLSGEIRIHSWKNYEDKLVDYKQLNTWEVKSNRAKYRWKKNKIEKERAKQARELRKQSKHQESKKKQNRHKAQRLINKTQ